MRVTLTILTVWTAASWASSAGANPAYDKCVAVFDGAMNLITQEQNALADRTIKLRGNAKAKCSLGRTEGIATFKRHVRVTNRLLVSECAGALERKVHRRFVQLLAKYKRSLQHVCQKAGVKFDIAD